MRKIKSILTIFLAILVLVNSLMCSLITVDYEINKASIIESFCINKDKPQLNCDGKCFLAIKLREAHEQSEKEVVKVEVGFGNYIINKETLAIDKEFGLHIEHHFSYQDIVFQSYITSHFHPPQQVV